MSESRIITPARGPHRWRSTLSDRPTQVHSISTKSSTRGVDSVAKLALSMAAEEREAYLRTQRTIRLATNGREWPQVVPLWFVWVDQTLFMNSTLGNVSIENLHRDPRATGTVDDGDAYDELRGVLVQGEV